MIQIKKARGNWCNSCEEKHPTYVKEIIIGMLDIKKENLHAVAANLCPSCLKILQSKISSALLSINMAKMSYKRRRKNR